VAFSDENVKISIGSEKKIKVLIIPFNNEANKKIYKNSSLYREILFRSFYSFIGFIPSLDVPDDDVLRNINLGSALVEKFAEEKNVDIIIYGNYHLEGERKEPEVVYNLKVWDSSKKTNIIDLKYKTSTGREIFDTIDEMMSKVLTSALNISADSATIVFENFNIGKEQYELFVNNKKIDTITNTDYNYKLRIVPDVDYVVQLKRKRDNGEALHSVIRLQKYQIISIGYTGYGKVQVNSIAYKDNLKKYSLFLNDKEVVEGQLISNLQAGLKYTLSVKNDRQEEVFREDFYLRDAEVKVVNPCEKDYSPWHFKALTLDRNFLTLGIDYFPWRYFWVGIGAGASYASVGSNSLFFLSPFVEAGYYFMGDMAYDLRIGAGVVGRVNIFMPEDVGKSMDFSVGNYSPNAGIFVQLEWRFIVLRPVAYLVFGKEDIFFSYGLGIGFRL